jgi:hypothetical protein
VGAPGVVAVGAPGMVAVGALGVVAVGALGVVAVGAPGVVAVGAPGVVAVGAPTVVAMGAPGVVGWIPPPPPEPGVWLPVAEVLCACVTFVCSLLPVAPTEVCKFNFTITSDIGLLGIAKMDATPATSSTNMADTNASSSRLRWRSVAPPAGTDGSVIA